MAKNLDDLLKDFEKEAEQTVSSNRPLWEGSEADKIFNVDIHVWRKPGMGNTLQTIAGNKISIMTATCSFLTTLCIKNIITLDELKEMIELVEGAVKNE